MNTKLSLALLLLLPLSTPIALRTAPDDEESELATHMEKIEDKIKVMRQNMKEESTYPAALEALAEVQRLTLSCKALEPAAAAKLPDAERGAFVKAYRRTMVDFLMRQLELETALLDGDAAATKAAFNLFREMEDTSHERFAPEDG